MLATSKAKRISIKSGYRKKTSLVMIALCLSIMQGGSFVLFAPSALAQAEAPTVEDLEQALARSEANPSSAQARFEYAELLRKMGKDKEAAHQYIAVTDIDASYYVAYHMIAKHCKDAKILKEATRRLDHLKSSKPKELMLRVALSELLEAQGDYYHASRALVDIVFLDAIPEKYRKRVHDRITFLQAKARDRNAGRNASHTDSIASQEDPPLPEESIKRGLAASSIEKEDDFGNAPLKR